jgi:hypothetical protein
MRRPSPSAVIAAVALFVAVGGPAQAAKLIDGGDIRRGTVGSKQLKDRSIKARDLTPAAVRSLKATPERSIAADKLADDAVTTRALAAGSVLTGTVGDDSLTAADLAPNSVGADEVEDNAVGQAEIRTNGVGASEIAAQSIDSGEVVDGGLSVRDVARWTGSFSWAIPDLNPNGCEVARVLITGAQIAGDLLLVSPTTPWPHDLVYTANGTGLETEFKVQACNRGPTGQPPVKGATYVFRYAIFGA